MSELWETLSSLLGRAVQAWTSPLLGGSLLTLAAVFALTVWLRGGREGAWDRFLTRGVRADAIYTVFYVGGFYAFFVSGPIFRGLEALVDRYAPFLRANLLGGLPPLLQFVAASVILDGFLYWTHRALHASPLLWAFHSVHHSQEELTPFGNFRFHVVDVGLRTLVQFVPALLLGIPTAVWVGLVWVQVALDGLAHSGLHYGYGPLEGVVVSPRFHRLHHSASARHYNRNFGVSYSFWDRVFGTADTSTERPAAYGVPGFPCAGSVWRQLAYPFLALARRGRQLPAQPALSRGTESP